MNLHQLPALCASVLDLDPVIQQMSESFANKHHALFLGRGEQYPIALEGALNLDIYLVWARSHLPIIPGYVGPCPNPNRIFELKMPEPKLHM